MIIYNIKSFVTVTGFFVGLLFSTIIGVSPLELAINTILFTVGFYSFANLILAFYLKYVKSTAGKKFPKEFFENELNKVVDELEKKEETFMPQRENFKTVINKQINSIEESQRKWVMQMI